MKLLNIKAEQVSGKACGSTAHLLEGSGHRVRRLPPSHHGRSVQADPIKPALKPPGTKHLKP